MSRHRSISTDISTDTQVAELAEHRPLPLLRDAVAFPVIQILRRARRTTGRVLPLRQPPLIVPGELLPSVRPAHAGDAAIRGATDHGVRRFG